MEILESLNWRYATKKMNGNVVPQEKVAAILEAIRLAPSSLGLQPYSVFVITNPSLKHQILPIANNQQQIIDCSHLLVFTAWDNVTEERCKSFIELNAKVRNLEIAMLSQLDSYLKSLCKRNAEENFNWAARQTYIPFGMAIETAALLEVDATPMEGFKGSELDKLLELGKLGLKSVVLLPLGYRDAAKDWLASMKKVRRDHADFFIMK